MPFKMQYIGPEKLISTYHFELAALSEQISPFVNSFGCLGLPRRGLDTVVCTRGALPTLGGQEDQPHSIICLLNVPLICSKKADIYFGLEVDTVVCTGGALPALGAGEDQPQKAAPM